MASRFRQGAERGKLRIGLIIARKHGERNAVLAAGGCDLFHSVGPVAAAPQQSHNDELGAGNDVLDIDIDRHVMAEAHDVSEAQARAFRVTSTRQAGQLIVGRRQDDNVARRLAEVDRLLAIEDGTRRGRQKVHVRLESRR